MLDGGVEKEPVGPEKAAHSNPAAPAARRGGVRLLPLESGASRIESLALSVIRFARRVTPSGLLLLGDLAALTASGQLAVWLRHVVAPREFASHFYPAILIYSGLMALTYLAAGLYEPIGRSGPDELRRLTLTTTTLALVMTIVTYVSRGRMDIGVFTYVIAWGAALAAVPLARAVVRALFAHRRWWGRKAIVLAHDTGTACRLVRSLRDEPRLALRPTAVLTTDTACDDEIAPGLPQLRGPGPALSHARAHGVDYAIVTASDLNDPEALSFIRQYETLFRHWLIVPYFAHNYSLWVRSRDLVGLLGLELTNRLLNRADQIAKRAMDLVLTLITGVTALPLCFVISLAIKLDSRGPVLYRQERLGKDGKPFEALKFRSMVEDADERLHDYLEEHPELREEWEATQKLKKDPRITWLGRFLRRTSLDELPQLLNVLRGEMSLVGPRPIIVDEIRRYGWVWDLYKRVRPGITGQWQVSGRNDTSYTERTAMDAYYVRNWSVWLDLYILAKTIAAVARRDGAY